MLFRFVLPIVIFFLLNVFSIPFQALFYSCVPAVMFIFFLSSSLLQFSYCLFVFPLCLLFASPAVVGHEEILR